MNLSRNARALRRQMKPTTFHVLNLRLVTVVAVLECAAISVGRAADAKNTEPLKLSLPEPTTKGTPDDLPKDSNIEPFVTNTR